MTRNYTLVLFTFESISILGCLLAIYLLSQKEWVASLAVSAVAILGGILYCGLLACAYLNNIDEKLAKLAEK